MKSIKWTRRNKLSGTVVNGYEIKPGANLIYADLTWADLRGVDLHGAKLVRANLWWTNLYRAFFKNTTMPDGSIRN